MERYRMDQIKKDFLLSAALIDSHRSAFQRANVYSKDAEQVDRDEFVKLFRKKLISLEKVYAEGVSEVDHIKNLIMFKEELSADFPKVLADGRMLLGVAQKAVNLYVKYLWVLDFIPQPPHCPVDRIILNKVGINNINWTTLDNVDEYWSVIETIRKVADKNKLSIPEWECNVPRQIRKNIPPFLRAKRRRCPKLFPENMLPETAWDTRWSERIVGLGMVWPDSISLFLSKLLQGIVVPPELPGVVALEGADEFMEEVADGGNGFIGKLGRIEEHHGRVVAHCSTPMASWSRSSGR
jgi:hypothetical protein